MWNIIQCAMVGQGHLKEGVPCQDKTYTLRDGAFSIAVLADGAGSASLSHLGAEIVTQNMAVHFSQHFDDYYTNPDGIAAKTELVQHIQSLMRQTAKEQECALEDLASTLLLTAVMDERFIILHIGDGVIGYFKENELRVASVPHNGEYANSTIFTTSPNCVTSLTLIKGELNGIDGFVIMSDGAEVSLYHKMSHSFSGGLKRIAKMLTYISSEIIEQQLHQSFSNIIRKATFDDCSIVMMIQDHDQFLGYTMLSLEEKAKLLELRDERTQLRRWVARFDTLLRFMDVPQTVTSASRKIHLKPKYTKRYLERLLYLNFIERINGKYHTIIRM